MRSEMEMMRLIITKAGQDDRIRAAYMNGSRIDPSAAHDKYSDFDIVYVVSDIRPFTQDSVWIEYFGEILILQKPTDWYSHPYDYSGRDNFTYLMQFKDGNRIDLTLIDEINIESAIKDPEPRRILLNKAGIENLTDIPVKDFYQVQKPEEKEFSDCCNEFCWVSLYVAKGLCRNELMYARIFMEQTVLGMLLKMLGWSIGIATGFAACTGKNQRYLKRYLSTEEMEELEDLLPNGDAAEMYEKLIKMQDYFTKLSIRVAGALNYNFAIQQAQSVKEYLLLMKAD